MARVFVVYEHRLFHDILINSLANHTIVGSVARPTATLNTIIEAISESRANVVVLEGVADLNTAWRIVLEAEEHRRVILLDMERGVAQDYFTRTTALDALDDLSLLIGESNAPQLRA